MNKLAGRCIGTLLLGGFSIAGNAASFKANFDDGLVPPNTQVFGNTVVEATGGVSGGGVLKVTKAVTGQSGSFIISDLDAGATVYGFKLSAKMRVGGGTATPADGWSFCFAPDLPDGTWGEDGTGTGLVVGFDTYDNGAAEAPTVDVRLGGQLLASKPVPIADLISGSDFVPVQINLDADGSLDVFFNGKAFYTNYFLPDFQGLAGSRFGFGGRTGGATENVFVDDLSIDTLLVPTIGISLQPAGFTALEGSSQSFRVKVSNGDGATYQWLRDGQPIGGATSDTYAFTAVPADDGAKFSVRVTNGGVTLTSDEALLRVTRIDLPATPVVSLNFNDGQVPANTAVYGTALVDSTGGVGDSGALKLTIAENSQAGGFTIADPHAGAAVYGFAASFKAHVGGGTTPPADGFSFNFAPDLAEDVGLGEEGSGTGITVSFDTYDNGGGEAPSVDLKRGGQVVATRKVSAGFLNSGDGLVDIVFRLTPDGLFDLAWNGNVLYERVSVPGFTSIVGGRIGLYARTGGANENYWVDDLKVYTYLDAGVIRVATQPKSITVLPGRNATFTVEANDPATATYQWYRNGQSIAGATQASYTVDAAALADSGAAFKVDVKGPNNTATSEAAVLTVLDLSAPANPQVSYDFNSGKPAGTSTYGSALVDATGGVGDSGVLKLTINENAQNGGFVGGVVADGAEINGFTAAIKIYAGGGTAPPADGFSVNFANDLPNTVGEAENGGGTGLSIAFDTYDNGAGEAPSIDIRWKGALVVSKKVPLALVNDDTGFREILIRLKDGKLDLAYGDEIVYSGEPVTGFAPLSGVKLGLYARTGGLNANYWMDDVRLGVTKTTGPTRITRDPLDNVAFVGQQASFDVLVNDPIGVTYQWSRNGSVIAGATQSSYTTPVLSLADDASTYSVAVSGAGGAVVSKAARLGVLAKFDAGSNPVANFDFNNGATPDNSILIGTAFIDTTGGANNSGVLKLTVAENGQQGAFLAATPDNAASITDFVATWRMRVGGGTDAPADGFSFVLGSDIGDAGFGEDGTGTGLVVSFDIYDNGGGEAPAIDITYGGNSVASRKFPLSVIRTGDQFVDVGVRVKTNGALDLYYGETAVYYNLALPDFKPFAAGRFGFGARTGGLNENQWVDDLKLNVNSQPVQITGPSIQRSGDGKIQVVWAGSSTLESTTTINGGWQTVAGAVSPFTLNTTDSARFYRLRQ